VKKKERTVGGGRKNFLPHLAKRRNWPSKSGVTGKQNATKVPRKGGNEKRNLTVSLTSQMQAKPPGTRVCHPATHIKEGSELVLMTFPRSAMLEEKTITS